MPKMKIKNLNKKFELVDPIASYAYQKNKYIIIGGSFQFEFPFEYKMTYRAFKRQYKKNLKKKNDNK